MSRGPHTSEREPDRPTAEELLCAEVLAEAQREAEQLLERARAQAGEIVAAAQQQADTIRREAAESARAEASLRSGFILAAVQLQQARMRASRVEALLDQLRSEARRRLVSRDGFDARDTIIRLAVEALARMEGTDFVLMLSASDCEGSSAQITAEIRRRLGRTDLRLELRPDPAFSECGVVVSDREGRRIWDNRVTARLDRMWPAMRRELARRIGVEAAEDGGAG